MSPAALTAFLVAAAVLATMLLEAVLSAHNERRLRSLGAIEPSGDVYQVMRVAYPLSFVAMGLEAALNRSLSHALLLSGLGVFLAAKLLKFWVMATLGPRWSFRVLVLPRAPLIESGPYRILRHPNYLAVLGELIGMAIALSAPLTGVAAVCLFGWLLWRRIRVEEQALGLRT